MKDFERAGSSAHRRVRRQAVGSFNRGNRTVAYAQINVFPKSVAVAVLSVAFGAVLCALLRRSDKR